MRVFQLRGIAEGLTGQSQVTAASIEDVFKAFPQLVQIKDKLQIDGDVIKGFAPCDG